MPFDFETQEQHIDQLVLGISDDADVIDENFKEEVRLLYDSKLFFVRSGRPLYRRGFGLHKIIQEQNIIPARERPSVQDWQDVSIYRAITLRSAMRIRHALERIVQSDCAAAIDCISTGAGVVLSLQRNDIVPSIFHADKKALREAREATGLKRTALSQAVFNNISAVACLEDGERGRDFRITENTTRSLYNALSSAHEEQSSKREFPSFEEVFGYHYERAHNCLALERSRGNIFELR